MSESADKDSKTEEATEKKIQDTVEKGKLPHSKEVSLLASFIAILVFTVFFAKESVFNLGSFLSIFLEKPEMWPLGTQADLIQLYQVVLIECSKALGAMLLLLIVAGVGASVLQHAPAIVLDRITPKASHISITKGWTRLFGAQGFVEFIKSLAKLIFVIAVLVFTLSQVQHQILSGMITQPAAFGIMIREVMINILTSITFVMTLIAVADLIWSRFKWRTDLRMTKQEVKDEVKQSDGDPIIKSRMRSIARDRARQRMLTSVPKATLIIANPTHFSIALKYVRDEDAAPLVLAKGQDLIALKIREIAQEHNIPIFEDVALARSMYKQVSIDSVIPPQFYQAVAELVRTVYGNKTKHVSGKDQS